MEVNELIELLRQNEIAVLLALVMFLLVLIVITVIYKGHKASQQKVAHERHLDYVIRDMRRIMYELRDELAGTRLMRVTPPSHFVLVVQPIH